MTATRLLILGVLRITQPTHGYDIRRELESWRADYWANIAYGSIYHALAKMSEEGLIKPVDTNQAGKRPAKTTYAITETGEREFQRLLREYWWETKPVIDPFQVALTFMDALPRDELLVALRHRANQLRLDLESFEWATKLKTSPPGTPRHIAENMRLAAAHAEAELHWATETIDKIERGELP
jgi:DNA-binding PadR family transcriptional regulator